MVKDSIPVNSKLFSGEPGVEKFVQRQELNGGNLNLSYMLLLHA